jgi:hypothetical protein
MIRSRVAEIPLGARAHTELPYTEDLYLVARFTIKKGRSKGKRMTNKKREVEEISLLRKRK